MSSATQRRLSFPHSSDKDWLFSRHEEEACRYCPGGLHLVTIGEVYESSIARYKIVGKLGWGSFSTVWLASIVDQHGTARRALKFRKSNMRAVGMERAMLRRIAASQSDHPGREYMVRLYDDFEVCGPNGKHEVFVTEATGPTLDDMISERLPDSLVRRWVRQLLLSLGYLATEGIVHGGSHIILLLYGRQDAVKLLLAESRVSLPDLHPNNISLAVTFLDGHPEEEVVTMFAEGSISDTSCNNPAMARFVGLTVPKQTITPGTLFLAFEPDGVGRSGNLDLRILDFGQAVPSDRLEAYSLHTPDTFRAPELLLFRKPSATNPFAADMWAAGCIVSFLVAASCSRKRVVTNVGGKIFTLATKQPLFPRSATISLKEVSLTIGGTRPAFWPESKWSKDAPRREYSRLPDDGSTLSEFMRLILAPDPACRPALPLDDILNHAWLAPPPSI